MLLYPVVFAARAEYPLAVLLLPVVFAARAEYPLAVLLYPVVFAASAEYPNPELLLPVVSLTPLPTPTKQLYKVSSVATLANPLRAPPLSIVESAYTDAGVISFIDTEVIEPTNAVLGVNVSVLDAAPALKL